MLILSLTEQSDSSNCFKVPISIKERGKKNGISLMEHELIHLIRQYVFSPIHNNLEVIFITTICGKNLFSLLTLYFHDFPNKV